MNDVNAVYYNWMHIFLSRLHCDLSTTYRLTGSPCNRNWIVGAPKEMGPANGTAGSHLPVAPEKLAKPQL